MPTRTGPPTVSGRWSLLPGRGVVAAPGSAEIDQTMRAHALALTLLERHGVLTRGAVAAERITGGFAAVYPVLRATTGFPCIVSARTINPTVRRRSQLFCSYTEIGTIR